MKSLFVLFFIPFLLMADRLPTVAISSENDIAYLQNIAAHIPITITAYNTSLENILALQNKKIDFAIINSDSAYHAQEMMPTIRSIVALYPKMLTFITKKDANITSIKDIKNKHLHIAYAGKDMQLFKQVLSTYDINDNTKAMTFESAKEKLKSGELDGFFSLLGHPSRQLKELSLEQHIALIPLFGKKFDQLKSDFSYILKGGVPEKMYGVEEDIKSIGVKALLVTRADVNETLVHSITKDILENMQEIKKTNLTYRGISKKSLLKGLVIPQHKAATKAFNEF